ncbi:hypothetical protein EYZ11_007212 [Aspergillus tanneri]|uniref:Uncharacterized protein n=1 Tax=Aspergillus tanneri TaxID=1220188 RepID=A0A4S3JDJ7_9EURO|nr:hypothetical protein EYZ11_007212 [Aspergillus tanneri]
MVTWRSAQLQRWVEKALDGWCEARTDL